MGSRPALRAALAFVALVGADVLHAGAASAAAVPPNLIKDPGAEQATPSGWSQVPVPWWRVDSGTEFTAIAYGTSGGFPTNSSPGPADRGRSFFSGGTSGTYSGATQAISLKDYLPMIQAGNASFSMTGWFGGYSAQGDLAYLDVYWKDANGGVLGAGRVGPVTESQRGGVTGLVRRTTSGIIPRKAVKASVHLHMVRSDGTYNDGYADNLSLTIQHR